jgi:hypothetical protein
LTELCSHPNRRHARPSTPHAITIGTTSRFVTLPLIMSAVGAIPKASSTSRNSHRHTAQTAAVTQRIVTNT